MVCQHEQEELQGLIVLLLQHGRQLMMVLGLAGPCCDRMQLWWCCGWLAGT